MANYVTEIGLLIIGIFLLFRGLPGVLQLVGALGWQRVTGTMLGSGVAGYQTQDIRISNLTSPTGTPVRLTLVAERRSGGRSGGRVRPGTAAAGGTTGSTPGQTPQAEPRHGPGQSEVLDPWR